MTEVRENPEEDRDDSAQLEEEAARQQAEIDEAIAAIGEIGWRTGRVTVEELLAARDEGRTPSPD